jgi:hypothetical protein
MNRRSTREGSGEWRKQWLSGQVPCGTSTGAVLRGGVFHARLRATAKSDSRFRIIF